MDKYHIEMPLWDDLQNLFSRKEEQDDFDFDEDWYLEKSLSN